jgi:hypothetical protein
LFEFVETASPVVWAAARRQVLVLIIQNTIWATLLLIATGIMARASVWATKEARKERYSADAWVVLTITCALTGIFTLLVTIICINSVIGQVINPDYYAIEALLELFITE